MWVWVWKELRPTPSLIKFLNINANGVSGQKRQQNRTPSYFQPITLTTCIGKLFTSILKDKNKGAPVSHLLQNYSPFYLRLTKLQSVSRKRKLKFYKLGISSRLTWDLAIYEVPLTWVERTFNPLSTKYLKTWVGMAKPAPPPRLFLPEHTWWPGSLQYVSHVLQTICLPPLSTADL